MLKKSIINTLLSLTADEKGQLRSVFENNSTPAPQNAEGKEVIDEKKDEKLVAGKDGKEVGEQKIDGKKETDTKDGEKKTELKEDTVKTKNPENKVEPKKVDGTEEVVGGQGQVQQAEVPGNGIRIDDLVTKSELMERLSAMEAKFDAVVKENKDLKDKYEEHDFGNIQKQGVMAKDKSMNGTFEEYAKQFE